MAGSKQQVDAWTSIVPDHPKLVERVCKYGGDIDILKKN